MCDLIVKIASDYGCRVILTTHSRHVLDALDGRAQFIWVQDGSASPATNEDHLDILMDLGALDIREVAQNDLKFFVLTEDKNKSRLRDLFLSSNYDASDFGIFSYFGVTEPHKLKALAHFIQDMRPKATIIVHRDRDFMTPPEVEVWAQQVRDMKLQPYVTEKTDIEDCFLNAGNLAEKNDLTELEAGALIKDSLEELRVDAIRTFVNGRIEIMRKGGITNLNMGELAEAATKQIGSDLRSCIKGKALLAKARSRFKAYKGVNLKVFGPSASTLSQALSQIRKLQK